MVRDTLPPPPANITICTACGRLRPQECKGHYFFTGLFVVFIVVLVTLVCIQVAFL